MTNAIELARHAAVFDQPTIGGKCDDVSVAPPRAETGFRLGSIRAELGNDSDSDIARAIREGAQESVGDAGQEVVRRQLEVRPTLTIRPGQPVRVIVTRDLILEPHEATQ